MEIRPTETWKIKILNIKAHKSMAEKLQHPIHRIEERLKNKPVLFRQK